MLRILEVPEVRRRVAPISVETYHRLTERGLIDQRTELLRGAIVEKMSKSPLHVAIVRRLFERIVAVARADQLVRKEDPLTLVDSEPEPDLSVVAGRPDDFQDKHPKTALFVAEVAVSTEAADREKAAIYAEAEVSEYWLVLPESRTVEVYRGPAGSRYDQHRVFTWNDVVVSTVLPDLRVGVAELLR